MDSVKQTSIVYIPQKTDQRICCGRITEIVASIFIILSVLSIGEMVLFSGANYFLTIPAFVGALSLTVLVVKFFCGKKAVNENALGEVVWEHAIVVEEEVKLHGCYHDLVIKKKVNKSLSFADVTHLQRVVGGNTFSIDPKASIPYSIVSSTEGIEEMHQSSYDKLEQSFTLSREEYQPKGDGSYYMDSAGMLCKVFQARKTFEIPRTTGRALVIPQVPFEDSPQPGKMISIPIVWSHDSLDIDYRYYLNSMVAAFGYVRSTNEKRPSIHVACPWGNGLFLTSSTRAMVSLFIAAAKIADVDLIFHPEAAPERQSLIMPERAFETLTQELLETLINVVEDKKTPKNLLSYISYQGNAC